MIDELETALELLRKGDTLVAISARWGVPLSTLQSRLVRRYGRGYRSVVPVPPMTEEGLVHARRLVLEGRKLRQVGRLYNRNEKAMSAALIRRWGKGYRKSIVTSLREDINVERLPRRHRLEVEAWLETLTDEAARGLLDGDTGRFYSQRQERGHSVYETGRGHDLRDRL